jgi:hypothetical protein
VEGQLQVSVPLQGTRTHVHLVYDFQPDHCCQETGQLDALHLSTLSLQVHEAALMVQQSPWWVQPTPQQQQQQQWQEQEQP